MIKALAAFAFAATSLVSHAGNFNIDVGATQPAWVRAYTPCVDASCGGLVTPRRPPCVLSHCPDPTPWPHPFPKPEPKPWPVCPPWAICIDPRLM